MLDKHLMPTTWWPRGTQIVLRLRGRPETPLGVADTLCATWHPRIVWTGHGHGGVMATVRTADEAEQWVTWLHARNRAIALVPHGRRYWLDLRPRVVAARRDARPRGTSPGPDWLSWR